jgi:hypothetical protein
LLDGLLTSHILINNPKSNPIKSSLPVKVDLCIRDSQCRIYYEEPKTSGRVAITAETQVAEVPNTTSENPAFILRILYTMPLGFL